MSENDPDDGLPPEPSEEPLNVWYENVWNVILVIIFTLLLVFLLMWVFGIAALNAPIPPPH